MRNINWLTNRWDTTGSDGILGVEPPRIRAIRPVRTDLSVPRKDLKLSQQVLPNPEMPPSSKPLADGGGSADTLGPALAMLGAVIQTSKSIGKTHERNNENQTKGLAMLDEAQKEIEKLRQSLQGGGEQVPFRALKIRHLS